MVANFAEMLANIFEPLFKVTLDPASDPQLHYMLQQLVGFDCVDDESKMERAMEKSIGDIPADQWDTSENPPYAYYLYYLHVNLRVLNELRNSRGMNTFAFRPHTGEAGDASHLAAGFILADGINHGITLNKHPALQYMYYMAQVGIAMSPMSNNTLFLKLAKNPFLLYFNRGLNVSLSTDDPLQFHHTHEPLLEEYLSLIHI